MRSFVVALWARLPRPLRVLAASGTSTTVDTAVLFALVAGLGVGPGLATFAGCLAGGAVNFAINRRFVFGARAGNWLVQALHYGLIVVGGGALLAALAVAAGCALGLPLAVAKAITTVLVLVVWTYPMSARVVFAPARAAPALG